MARYEFNEEHNGIEIYFDSIPSDETRATLRENGWRWYKAKKCWYTRRSDASVSLAQKICGEIVVTTEAAPTKVRRAKTTDEPVVSYVMPEMTQRYCYADTVANFLKIGETAWIKEMKSGFSDAYMLALGSVQIGVWKDCFRVLQEQLPSFNKKYPNFSIVFEYSLPYESGRRPDVLLISNEFVVILEFKKKDTVLRADIDQVAAYARDIEEYHYESRDKDISAILVVTEMSGEYYDKSGVSVCSGDLLHVALEDSVAGKITACNLSNWINSRYEPLPTIVEAARMIMKKEALPNIRRVNSTGIPDAIKLLEETTLYAKKNKKHILALVTGVPGAGKTFLGLQFVYNVCEEDHAVNSVYLSGNGPLVQVLTDALGSGVFVKDLHKVENEYIRNGARDFKSNVIVFDEGQRAWDKKQMADKKRGHNVSEPDVMVKLAEERLEWCVLLVLVGEGQEIHNGENSGVAQWNDALNNSDIPWEVICPDKLAYLFEDDQDMIEDKDNSLDLTVSLRTHLAGDVSNFVNHVISGEIDEAEELVETINEAGFTMLITRDINDAKEYCRTRYEGSMDKRYGMLQSSKAWNLKRFGVYSKFRPDCGAWYNTPVGSGNSCCDLKLAISEFDCQGLELDMPIVCWGTDMIWNGRDWDRFNKSEAADSDANTYRKNSYRVLLTRGRDGFIIFVPENAELDSVYQLFVDMGIEEI